MTHHQRPSLSPEQAAALEQVPLTTAWAMAAEVLDKVAAALDERPEVREFSPWEREIFQMGIEVSSAILRGGIEEFLAAQVKP